jgi:hypothetical protein
MKTMGENILNIFIHGIAIEESISRAGLADAARLLLGINFSKARLSDRIRGGVVKE